MNCLLESMTPTYIGYLTLSPFNVMECDRVFKKSFSAMSNTQNSLNSKAG